MATKRRSHRAIHAAALARKEAAVSAIYAAVADTNTRFSECMLHATAEQRAEYSAAVSAAIAAEMDAIAAGKAWRSALGSVIFN